MNNQNQIAKLVWDNYTRKSQEDKERQALSIGSQFEWADEVAEKRGIKIHKRYKEEKSAETPYQRPVFDELVNNIRTGKANAIICWKLDRLARNPEEAGIILGMLKRGEIKYIITSDRDYRPEDNSLISYVDFGMADQYSRDLSKNVKRGLKTKLNMGWYPSRAPLGYLNTKFLGKGNNTILKDQDRFDRVKQMWQMMLTGNYSVPQILDVVNNEWKFLTRETPKHRAQPLSRSMLYKILKNRFYCGAYEYPVGSGEWYEGKHEPMVTKDEFERVQDLLGNISRPRPLTRRFAFTGIMVCGNCGAAITAEEKVKRQKNGNVHHYIYYRCTKRIDPECPEKMVDLAELTAQADVIVRGLTISARFQNWAIKYLHEVRKHEAKTHEQIIAEKQKRVLDITKQMDNLLLRLTSPSNADGTLISDEEYKQTKGLLLNERHSLESDLQTQGRAVEQWIELSERTFNFARYAAVWFKKGDIETKRAIFACLGSDFIVKSQKLNIQLRKPFQFIFDNLEEIEKEMLSVITAKNSTTKGQSVTFVPSCVIGRRM